jgi:hypothetical protein
MPKNMFSTLAAAVAFVAMPALAQTAEPMADHAMPKGDHAMAAGDHAMAPKMTKAEMRTMAACKKMKPARAAKNAKCAKMMMHDDHKM